MTPIPRLLSLTLLSVAGWPAGTIHGQDPASDHYAGELRLELQIGEDLGAPEYTFSSIQAVRPAPDGRIFVLDGQEMEVRAYDARGRFIIAFGGFGAGPGEFTWPVDLLVNSVVTVFDGGQRRVSRFSLGGEHLETRRLPELRGLALVQAFPLQGDVWLGITSPRFSLGHPTHDPYVRVLAVPAGTKRVDTLIALESGGAVWHPSGRAYPWGVIDSGFGDGGAWAVLGDSLVVVAHGHDGWVRWYHASDSGLRQVREIRLPGDSRPVTEADLRALKERVRREEQDDRGDPIASTVEIVGSGRWSIASDAIFSDDGRLWIRGAVPAERLEWTVFGPDGRRLGRQAVPESFRLHAVRGERLYGVRRTAMEADVVRVYQRVSSPESP